jgi:hypothetical protein
LPQSSLSFPALPVSPEKTTLDVIARPRSMSSYEIARSIFRDRAWSWYDIERGFLTTSSEVFSAHQVCGGMRKLLTGEQTRFMLGWSSIHSIISII